MSIQIDPKEKTYYTYQMIICNARVCIHTNIHKLPYLCIYANGLTEVSVGISADYSITLLHSCAFAPNIVSDDIVVENWKDKTDNVYPNDRYNIGAHNISLFTYPNNSIHITNVNKTDYFLASSRIDVLVFYLKRIIKEIASKIYINNGFLSLHAAAVAQGERCCVFIGKSRAGKSTLCYNLSLSGFEYINDDVIFVKRMDNKWLLNTIPLYLNLREEARGFLVDSEIINSGIYSEYQKTYVLNQIPMCHRDVYVSKVFFLRKFESHEDTTLDEKEIFAKVLASTRARKEEIKEGENYLIERFSKEVNFDYLNICSDSAENINIIRQAMLRE